MIKFKKIRLKNFKNIGGAWAEIDFDDTGFYRIQGRNGCGKTTLLSATTYALFGKNSDMRNDSSSPISTAELINDLNKKELEVELFLDNGMVIRRGLKPDFFEIIDEQGINLADKSSKVIDQNFLEQEILDGMTFQMFHKLTYISSKSISTPFLYMTPSQRKEFLEHVLDIRLIYYVGEEAKKRISEKKLDLKTIESQRASQAMSVESEKQNLINLTRQQQSQMEEIAKMKANKNQMIEGHAAQIANLELEVKEKEAELADETKSLNSHQEKVKNQEEVVVTFKANDSKINIIQSQLKEIQSQMLMKKNEKDVFDRNVAGFTNCGTCEKLKFITGEFDEAAYVSQMQFWKDNGIALATELAELVALGDSSEQIKILDELKSTKYQISTSVLNKEHHLKSLQAEINSNRESIHQLQTETEIKPITISHDYFIALQTKLDELDASFDLLKNQIEQLERIRKRVGDKTLHRQVMEQYVPIFQSKVNELLAIFMEDDPFSFSMEFDEEFNLTGKKNGRDSNLFKLSEGQKTSIHFAILFAMHYIIGLKNANASPVLMIDEILDLSLDSSRVTKVVEYLKELSANQLIVLISHNEDISSEYFDKIIEVTKVHNFSHYEVL